MKRKIIRIILIILILLWMWMVFGFSSDNAEESTSISFRISKFLVHTDEKAEMIQPYVRKLAHLSEYTAGRIFILWTIFNF